MFARGELKKVAFTARTDAGAVSCYRRRAAVIQARGTALAWLSHDSGYSFRAIRPTTRTQPNAIRRRMNSTGLPASAPESTTGAIRRVNDQARVHHEPVIRWRTVIVATGGRR
jgi:hypothetical protein